jgi:prophage regulatory protein
MKLSFVSITSGTRWEDSLEANIMAQQIKEALSILRRKQVQARIGLSCATIYAYMSEGTFPKPVKLGPRAVGWIESEVDQWLDAQVKQTRGAQ